MIKISKPAPKRAPRTSKPSQVASVPSKSSAAPAPIAAPAAVPKDSVTVSNEATDSNEESKVNLGAWNPGSFSANNRSVGESPQSNTNSTSIDGAGNTVTNNNTNPIDQSIANGEEANQTEETIAEGPQFSENNRRVGQSPQSNANSSSINGIGNSVTNNNTNPIDQSKISNDGASLHKRLGEETLRLGSKGESVKALQEGLNNGQEEKLEVDGRFGEHTQQRLRDFQEGAELKADGLFGENSRAQLLERLKSGE